MSNNFSRRQILKLTSGFITGGAITSSFSWFGNNSVQAQASCNNHYYQVPLIPQPDKLSCWAASMAMLLSYKRNASFTPQSLARQVSRDLRTSYSWSMLEQVKNYFGFRDIALPSNTSLYLSPKQWSQWLSTYGPLWVTVVGNPSHAIIVHGLRGDCTPGRTSINVLNPWNTNTRFTSDPVDFYPSNSGLAYTQSFNNFAANFGLLGLSNYSSWRVLYLPR
jgi:hypothetical protein